MMMMKRTHALLLRNIIWALVIFLLCTMPTNTLPTSPYSIPHIDKLVHGGMFFIMALFLCSELNYQTKCKPWFIYLLTMFFCVLYGGVIEVLQSHVFHRSGDWWDWGADALGALWGCLLYPVVRKMKRQVVTYLEKKLFHK